MEMMMVVVVVAQWLRNFNDKDKNKSWLNDEDPTLYSYMYMTV